MSDTTTLDNADADTPQATNSPADPKQAPPQNQNADTDNKKVAVADICFAIIQDTFVAGDITANADKIRNHALNAHKNGADVVIFSELALFGAYEGDLVNSPELAERVKKAITKLAQELKDVVTLVGYPHVDHYGVFNSVAVLSEGTQKGFYHKRFLNEQGDEKTNFNKGNNQVIFEYKGVFIGLCVGDDVFQKNALKLLKSSGADLVVAMNASTFAANKNLNTKKQLEQVAKDQDLPIIWVNTIGGQDAQVFDGGSMVVGADGAIVAEAPRFLANILLAKYTKANRQFEIEGKQGLQLSEESEIYQALMVGLRDYVNRSGFNGVIVGLSGGIDSALTLCIARDALGSDKVYAVMMPYQYTSNMSLEDAEAQAKSLNVSYTVCPIHDAVAGLRSSLAPLFDGDKVTVTEENIQARTRGTILMALSNRFGYMVVNTTNKSEAAVGYGTLYGDLVGGYGVLKDVYKTDIYRLAQYRNRLEDSPVIPERVLERAPSAELRPNQTDQDNLPDYEALDGILRLYIEENKSLNDIIKAGFEQELVKKVIAMVNKNEYKRRQAPLGTTISDRAFGVHRNYPLVNGWKLDFV